MFINLESGMIVPHEIIIDRLSDTSTEMRKDDWLIFITAKQKD